MSDSPPLPLRSLLLLAAAMFVTMTAEFVPGGLLPDTATDLVAMVRNFLATVTSEELAATRKNPWVPEYPETTLSCLHTILDEEWEHHRYAVRDLDTIEAKPDA